MIPEKFRALLESTVLIPKERTRAWDLYKNSGPADAVIFVQKLHEAMAVLRKNLALRDSPVPYQIWGPQHIEAGAIAQMLGAARLPVSVAGALMPDAHQGYGLPIGGVLATDNVVIPYAVGVDIACRMMLTVYPVTPDMFDQPQSPVFMQLQNALVKNTVFGSGRDGLHDGKIEHPILDKARWMSSTLTCSLRQSAIYQIGTSGGGNHFVEWGELEIMDTHNALNLPIGRYLALLSHSGSRGVGYKIANYYTQLAMAQMPDLDNSVKHLAWLSLDSAAGLEYWDAMQLAGEFASANHHVIHSRIARALELTPIAKVENHHNFAWRETIMVNGVEKEVIVHRKGATPAGKGVLGIIPGTMADPGFLVVGKGCSESLNSASHGSGRRMSRTAAKQKISLQQQTEYLAQRKVTLIGAGLDESPQAYKPIQEVMDSQKDLVGILGMFHPRIVRMATDEPPGKRKPVPEGVFDAEND